MMDTRVVHEAICLLCCGYTFFIYCNKIDIVQKFVEKKITVLFYNNFDKMGGQWHLKVTKNQTNNKSKRASILMGMCIKNLDS